MKYKNEMKTTITIHNSILGKTTTYPINEEDINFAKQHPYYDLPTGNLVSSVYYAALNGDIPVLFTSAVCYLLNSKTYNLTPAPYINSYYLYLSRGEGEGFIGMCGASSAKNIQEAADNAELHFESMVPHYVAHQKTRSGSNYTKPKKKRK